jgi:hypothetical protein
MSARVLPRSSRRWTSVVGARLVACGVVCSVGACAPTADVRITGTVGGRALRATGTVVAWVDRTLYVPDDDGALVLVDRAVGDTRLQLRFFESVFDPATSFDRLTSGERAALEDELARGDQLGVDVARGAALRDGDEIASVAGDGVPEVLPYIASIDVAVRDAARGAASYPETLVGAVVVDDDATLSVNTVAPRLAGELRFHVAGGNASADSGDDDGDEISVAFATALLPERVAECNFDRSGAGAVDACSLAPTTP